ncbi:MAG: hypothetical protein KF891_12350 [Rhizobacter sp.]|nr:hypothetical protein [Rhizobacter sp.]
MKALIQRAAAGLALSAAALLAACGGGGSTSSTDAQPEGVYQGTIGGFGSVIVNGVRFDDSHATVTLDDEASTAGALKLGMRTQVQGTVSADGSTGTATSVIVETAVRGAVSSVDVAANQLRIRAITVQADDNTVFEGASGIASIQAGDWVEVHGSVDFANRRVQATRIEVKSAQDIGRVVMFGTATAATATSFTLGDLTVDYSQARLIGFSGGTVPEGTVVRVRSHTSPVGNVLQASVVKAVKAPRFLDGTPAAVEGRVQQFVSVADFLVSGTAVDASHATFENGSAADLSEGKRVIVTGTLADGKIVAKKLRFFRPDLDGEVRLIGTVTDYVSQASFKVRGVAVDASAAEFVRGSAAELANGRVVEIKGESVGSVVQATKVIFEEVSAAHVLTGIVTDFVSAGSFKVAGDPVTLAADVRYVNGAAGDLTAGVRVWLVGDRTVDQTFVAKVVIFVPGPGISPTQVAGTVSDVALDGSFKLNGTMVTTSLATQYVGGTAADVTAGTWVVVTGRVTDGVLAAQVVAFPQHTGSDECKAFKFEGVVYDFVSVSNFKLFGFTIDASGAAFEDGTAADLANGRAIEVCGEDLPVNGLATATKVEFKVVH